MSDQIITDIPLIQRYSRHNENEDFRFRHFLKFRLDSSNKRLDEIVKLTTDDVWSEIDCTKCANCCKTMQVVVDNKDIKRLATRLGMSPQEFFKQYITKDKFEEMYFSSIPCRFLGEDNRCTVYEDRPASCRDYPYLYKPGFRQRTLTMVCNVDACPIVFNVWQALKRRFWPRSR